MSRDYVNEIAIMRQRSEFKSRFHFSERLFAIRNLIKENFGQTNPGNAELLKYIPIASVACMEAFFRSTIKELIDSGEPYTTNAGKFNQSRNIKFDFRTVNAVQSKELSVGDFISHILPCNNFEDINSNLSALVGFDFLEKLKMFKTQSRFHQRNDLSETFYKDSGRIISDIKTTFRLRHIFCHEFALNVTVNRQEILECFESVQIFLNQVNFFIWSLLYPNAPETQSEMKERARIDFEQKEQELLDLVSQIKRLSDVDVNLFEYSLAKWNEYREAKAKFDSAVFSGGTFEPILYYPSLTKMTEEKIQELRKDYNESLGINT